MTVFRGTEEEKRGGKDEDEGGGNGEQAGILSAMASKIGMAMSGNGTHGGSGEYVDHSKGEGEDKEKEMGGDEPSSNGGGIVKQIMSNVPTSGALPANLLFPVPHPRVLPPLFQLTGFVLSVFLPRCRYSGARC